MLAQTDSFQEFCSASSTTLALEHIWMEQLPEPANGESYNDTEKMLYQCHAILSSINYGRKAVRTVWTFDHSGSILIQLGRLVDHIELPELDEIQRRFKNKVGKLPEEILTLLHGDGGVPIVQFEFVCPSMTKRHYEHGFEMIRVEMKVDYKSYAEG